MNFFPPELRPLLVRVAWRRLSNEHVEPPDRAHYVKVVCHMTAGIAVAVSDLSSSSWVGSLSSEQLGRCVTVSAPGVQATTSELLRLVDDCVRQGRLSLRLQNDVAPQYSASALLLHCRIEMLEEQHLLIDVPVSLHHVCSVQTAPADRAILDFAKELVTAPALTSAAALQHIISLLLQQHKISNQELLSVIQFGFAPPLWRAGWHPDDVLSQSPLVDGPPWLELMKQACFQSLASPAPQAAPLSASDPPGHLATLALPADRLIRRSSEYAESPEEAARRRKREADASARPAESSGERQQKKIRKALL